jgi:adenylate cyclase
MGRVVLRGRASPVELFEPAPDFPAEARADLAAALAMLDTDPATAITRIEAIAQSNPADTALQNLLLRCRGLNKEGSYVLG